MKKIFLYFFAFLFICFILPALFTKRTTNTVSNVNNEQNEKIEEVGDEKKETYNSNYEYKKYATVKLLHTKTNTVEEIKIDDYMI